VLLHELRPDHPPVTWLFEPESFAPLARMEGEQRCWAVSDWLGTPLALYHESGEEAWQASAEVAAGSQARAGTVDCPWRWPGQYADPETGLHYNRFRYYDPEAGQYLSPDPIGLRGGLELYSYPWDSGSEVDPLGLAKSCGAQKPKNRWHYIREWHDKRADAIFGSGKGRPIGKRRYDKHFKGRDIEFKSDNFSRKARSQKELDRISEQLKNDIDNKVKGVAKPHWHFDHDPRVAKEMAPILEKMDKAGIPWSWGAQTPTW
jgi:RHS repeat-associated protein